MWPHESFPKRPRRGSVSVDLLMVVLIVALLVVGGVLVMTWP